MERKLIGSVSEQERDEIRTLFERKNGLNELFKVLDAENEALRQPSFNHGGMRKLRSINGTLCRIIGGK